MPCQNDAIVEGVYGDWIRKSSQNPPNASQADRDAAQQSADKAADGAADAHCSTGECADDKVCVGKRNPRVVRTYTFEDGEFRRVHYIRAKVVVARYDCVCKKKAKKKAAKKKAKKKVIKIRPAQQRKVVGG